MISITRVALQASLLVATGWLVRDPSSIPVWQIGLALLLGTTAVFWMWLSAK